MTDPNIQLLPELIESQFEDVLEQVGRLRADIERALHLVRMATVGGSSYRQLRSDKTPGTARPVVGRRRKGSTEEDPPDEEPIRGLGPLAPIPHAEEDKDDNAKVYDLDDDELYTVRDAAIALGRSEHTIRIYARDEGLEFTRSGTGGGRGKGEYRFTGRELKRFHEQHKRRS